MEDSKENIYVDIKAERVKRDRWRYFGKDMVVTKIFSA